MTTKTISRCAGLQTAPNVLSSAPNIITGASIGMPEGSYSELSNCVVRIPNVIESRRGQQDAFTITNSPSEMTYYAGYVIAYTSAFQLRRMQAGSLGGSMATYAGTYNPPALATLRMKFARAEQRLYFTTDAGIYRLDSVTGTPMPAGVGRPRIAWNSSRVVGDSKGFLPTDAAAGYRATLTKRDANSREMTSAPSDRALMRAFSPATAAIGAVVLASNVTTVTTLTPHGFRVGDAIVMTPGETGFILTGTVATVPSLYSFTFPSAAPNVTSASLESFGFTSTSNRCDMVVLLASDTATGDILRLWRTDTIAGANEEPGDEVRLAFEKVLTAADISAGKVTISDFTPDTMLGDSAYFAPSQEGIDNSNEAPPLARDICTFDGRMWFAYCQPKRQFSLTVLATGGTSGIVAGDTVTVALGSTTFTLTATSSAVSADGTAGNFAVYVTTDVAGDNERTALSLVSAINSASANTIVDAFYISGFADNPGRVLLQERAVGSVNPISVGCSAHGAAYVPQLPTSGRISGTAFNYPHRVYCSKQEEPDAVPLLDKNFFNVGQADDAILRIVRLSDGKLFVFKERSLWTITPSGDSYTVEEFDPAFALVGADTPAVMGGVLYCLSKRGPVAISTAGVSEIGGPIERDIEALFGYVIDGGSERAKLPTLQRYAFGCAYESEKLWLLGVSDTWNGTTCTKVYAWNGRAGVWTSWDLERTCAVVEPTTDLLYMGFDTTVKVERKYFDASDFRDEEQTLTLVSVGTSTDGLVTLTLDDASSVAVGAAVWDSVALNTADAGARGVVKTVSGDVLTLYPVPTAQPRFTTGTCSVFAPIPLTLALVPDEFDIPGRLKMLQAVNVHFMQRGFFNAQLSVQNDVAEVSADVRAFSRRGYFVYPGWVEEVDGQGPTNEWVRAPRELARANYYRFTLTLAEAEAQFRLAGWTFDFDVDTERTGR